MIWYMASGVPGGEGMRYPRSTCCSTSALVMPASERSVRSVRDVGSRKGVKVRVELGVSEREQDLA